MTISACLSSSSETTFSGGGILKKILLILWNNRFFKFLSCCGYDLWSLWVKFISALRFPCVLCSNLGIYRTFQRNDFLIKNIDCFLEFFNLLFFGLFFASELFDLWKLIINGLLWWRHRKSPNSHAYCNRYHESNDDEFPWWKLFCWIRFLILCGERIVHRWKSGEKLEI